MYGLLISFAILTVLVFISKTIETDSELDSGMLWEGAFYVISAGVLGARIYHVIDYHAYYLQFPIEILQIKNGGLGIPGALMAGTLCAYIYLRAKEQNVRKWFNAIAPYVPLGQAIGRLGNVFNQELLPYAYFEIILNLCLYMFLKKHRNNQFTLYIFGYAVIRLILEPLHTTTFYIAGYPVAQLISILIILAILTIYALSRIRSSRIQN